MEIRIKNLLLALAFLAGVHSAFAQVTNLGIAKAGGQSLLYWPAGSPTNNNYILQSTTNLVAANWTTKKYPVPVTASTVSNTTPAEFFRLVYTNPPAFMVLIPAGSFLMGNSSGDSDITDANPTNVYISAFFMDTNLVNLNIWQPVYTYATWNGYSFDNAGAGKAVTHPVQTVNWYDCVKWCNARSQRAGPTPVYYVDAGFTQVYKTGDVDAVYVNWAASGYRLPTEAEWEKAARGGLSGRRFPWGNLISEGQANYYGETNVYSYDLGPKGYNSIGSIGGTSLATSPVGSFDVNGYGLYDMTGNVFEWCWDWYGTPYGQPTITNPTGAGPGSGNRVLRGGYWGYDAYHARCASRYYSFVPNGANSSVGFRCVRGL